MTLSHHILITRLKIAANVRGDNGEVVLAASILWKVPHRKVVGVVCYSLEAEKASDYY